MTLDPAIAVFGGRQVVETVPAAGTVPSGFAASDGCYYSNAPWSPGQLTNPTLAPPWYVQGQSSGSTYGNDYVGLNPQVAAYIQQYSPNVPCTIQFPLQMVINVENVVGIGNDTYGGPNSGLNLLQINIAANSVSVSRGGAVSQ
jgi:hypothetical protein